MIAFLLALQFFQSPPIRWAQAEDFTGALNFCRGWYQSSRALRGGEGWHTDYPRTDTYLLKRVSELAAIRVGTSVVVKLDDPLLARCPFVFMEDVGTISLSDAEAEGLARYLEMGGFLWVDDFWGEDQWAQWAHQFNTVLPGRRWTDIPADHPIMRMLYDVKAIPQIPASGGWWPMTTSELGAESAVVHFRGIADHKGRLLAVASHNTDLADAFDHPQQTEAFFLEFGTIGAAVAANILLYAITH